MFETEENKMKKALRRLSICVAVVIIAALLLRKVDVVCAEAKVGLPGPRLLHMAIWVHIGVTNAVEKYPNRIATTGVPHVEAKVIQRVSDSFRFVFVREQRYSVLKVIMSVDLSRQGFSYLCFPQFLPDIHRYKSLR